MTPARWRQIRDLLDRALQLEAPERSPFLDRSCSSDHSLRQEVEKLLAAERELATSFLESPAEEHLRAAIHEALPRPAEFRGTERFAVQRRLGQGGFGVVYQVYDRQQDAVVALKALLEAHAGPVYDFKREFRGLANTVHRNLVRLYELLSDGE
jgi:hypothetical protein